MKPFAKEDPGFPCEHVEDASEPKTSGRAAWQNDCLEGIEQYGKQADNASNKSESPHWSSLFWNNRQPSCALSNHSILAELTIRELQIARYSQPLLTLPLQARQLPRLSAPAGGWSEQMTETDQAEDPSK
jgi:hypothetical protein